MALNWQLWDRIRALTRRANIYRTDNLYQDQSSLDKIIANGNFIDFSRQNAILEQTTLQINRLERLKDYDMMDEVGEVSLALDLYADESSLCDPERKHSIIVRAKSTALKKTVEDLLYNTLMLDRDIRPMIRYLCKTGDYALEIIPTKNRDGVASYRFLNMYNFTRVNTRYGELVGFYYQDPGMGAPVFMHPWQVMHMRLCSHENNFHPYGRSILEGGRKDFKRLRLMEDAALIYRITRAPEKRVFSIPVGNLPTQQIPQYIELIARQMKKTKFVDPATGQINERYNPLIQDDDFFLPKRSDGTGPSIDTLPGAENLDQIADIEYFKKKMVSAFKIPFNRVGIGDKPESDGRSLASSSPEFAKAIQYVQREVAIGIKKIVLVHLAMRGHPISDLKGFDLVMTSASAIDELYRIETWNTRADIIANLKDTNLFPDSWILSRFTDMTDEEIEEMKNKKEREVKAESIDTSTDEGAKLMREYVEFLKQNKEHRAIQEDMGASPEWFVNQNELDGLKTAKDEEIIKESIGADEAKEAKDAALNLITAGEGSTPEIQSIASRVEDK